MGNFFKIKKGAEREEDSYYDALDFLRDLISCILLMAVAGGWTMLCLLILSFMLIYYVPFHLNWMIPVSLGVAVAAGIVYVVRAVKKRRK